MKNGGRFPPFFFLRRCCMDFILGGDRVFPSENSICQVEA